MYILKNDIFLKDREKRLMKNDICITKINHLKVMNGLPMPIKALF